MPEVLPEQAERLRRAAAKARAAKYALRQFFDALPGLDESWDAPDSSQTLIHVSHQTGETLGRFADWVRDNVTDPETERRRAAAREYEQRQEKALAEAREDYTRWRARQPTGPAPSPEVVERVAQQIRDARMRWREAERAQQEKQTQQTQQEETRDDDH